jgi:hypothetical protein
MRSDLLYIIYISVKADQLRTRLFVAYMKPSQEGRLSSLRKLAVFYQLAIDYTSMMISLFCPARVFP